MTASKYTKAWSDMNRAALSASEAFRQLAAAMQSLPRYELYRPGYVLYRPNYHVMRKR